MRRIIGVSALDLEAGRLLARLTCGELARLAGLSEDLVFNLARGLGHLRTRRTFQWTLEARGIRFLAHGFVTAPDGRVAPTRKATGKMTGRRLRRARRALGLSDLELSQAAGVSSSTLSRLESGGAVRLTRSAYAVVGALQLAGYTFAPQGRDRALVRRVRVSAPPSERDLPMTWLGVGIGVNANLEFEAEGVVPVRRRRGATR